MNWWADRLNQGATESRPPARPQPPPPPEEQPVAPRTQRPPASSLVEDHCPACNSGNYMASPGSQYKRCYDCGHPISQSGTGVGSTQSDAPAKKSTQVKGGGFNPTTIIGKVEG